MPNTYSVLEDGRTGARVDPRTPPYGFKGFPSLFSPVHTVIPGKFCFLDLVWPQRTIPNIVTKSWVVSVRCVCVMYFTPILLKGANNLVYSI